MADVLRMMGEKIPPGEQSRRAGFLLLGEAAGESAAVREFGGAVAIACGGLIYGDAGRADIVRHVHGVDVAIRYFGGKVGVGVHEVTLVGAVALNAEGMAEFMRRHLYEFGAGQPTVDMNRRVRQDLIVETERDVRATDSATGQSAGGNERDVDVGIRDVGGWLEMDHIAELAVPERDSLRDQVCRLLR